jgi:hypothetical protein
LEERPGWSFIPQCDLSDHPVCGAKVGFAEVFLDAAATPPHDEEGE